MNARTAKLLRRVACAQVPGGTPKEVRRRDRAHKNLKARWKGTPWPERYKLRLELERQAEEGPA